MVKHLPIGGIDMKNLDKTIKTLENKISKAEKELNFLNYYLNKQLTEKKISKIDFRRNRNETIELQKKFMKEHNITV